MCIPVDCNGHSKKLIIMELISLRELQDDLLKKNIPFVSFRMPNSSIPVTYISKKKPTAIHNKLLSGKKEKGFIFCPFNHKLPSLWITADIALNGYHFENIQFNSVPDCNTLYESVTVSDPVSKEQYLHKIEQILNSIHSNQVNKVVLSRTININFDRLTESSLLFNNLSSNYHNAFVYLINIPGIGCWLGATPELLLSAKNESISSNLTGNSFLIQTMALAGTRPAGTSGKWDQKDIDEQKWVSKYIEQKLIISGCNKIFKSGPYTCPAVNVEHLRTDFSGIIDISRIDELLNELHPTPAVCGWPKNKALELIYEIEEHERLYYSGFLGPIDPKHYISVFVNLRCMEIHHNEAYLYVGGGVTIDSNPEHEWNETLIKSRTLLSEIEKIQNLAD